MNADHMPDDTPIRPLGSRMVCTKCGHVGADVRPDWSPHVNTVSRTARFYGGLPAAHCVTEISASLSVRPALPN
jgi:hypothetical protein